MTSSRILVVDDEADISTILSVTLRRAGFEVETAGDGVEAIDQIRRQPPDLVILDVMMPRADGYQVAEALRSIHGSETPILVLTAAGDACDIARRIGAEGYLAKPFELEQLIALVRQLLNPSRRPVVAGRTDASYIDTAAGN